VTGSTSGGRTSFTGRARAATGRGPTRTTEHYRVEVADGVVVLLLEETGAAVLQAPTHRVITHPVGRAGAVLVELDGAPVLVDFTDRRPGSGAVHTVRRAAHALRGRRVRRAFAAATRSAG
jgi:hypothetical protein